MESDDRIGVINHGCFEDVPGFEDDRVHAALAQDMEAEEFVFGGERNDAEFLDRLAF